MNRLRREGDIARFPEENSEGIFQTVRLPQFAVVRLPLKTVAASSSSATSQPRFLHLPLARGLITLVGVTLAVLAVQVALAAVRSVWPTIHTAVLNLIALLLLVP